MKKGRSRLLKNILAITLLLSMLLTFAACGTQAPSSNGAPSPAPTSTPSAPAASAKPASATTDLFTGALTIDEAMKMLPAPGAAAPVVLNPVDNSGGPRPEMKYVEIQPTKLFDNMYFVGTTSVGSFIFDTGEGLVMLDTGYGPTDCAIMVNGIKKLGLDPTQIKLIIVSHEHIDHYGGVNYLLENICPNAKVAMSLVGWNLLQATPNEWAFGTPRPKKCDIFLTDGMKIKLGNFKMMFIATPGHSLGCMSFIFPVIDHGTYHMAGVMGGSAVWPSQLEVRSYQASIEYFKAFTDMAKCDVGMAVHSTDADMAAIRNIKTGDVNPLIYGTDKFDTVYLQKYRNSVKKMQDSGTMVPYAAAPGAPATSPAPSAKS